jgi:hypothetical protein
MIRTTFWVPDIQFFFTDINQKSLNLSFDGFLKKVYYFHTNRCLSSDEAVNLSGTLKPNSCPDYGLRPSPDGKEAVVKLGFSAKSVV